MRRTRFTGMFQRCGYSCTAQCRRHRFCYHGELGRALDGRRQVTSGGFVTAADAAAARAGVVGQYRARRWPRNATLTVEHGLPPSKTLARSLRTINGRLVLAGH